MPLTDCLDMLTGAGKAMWCRAHGHDWIEDGDLRWCTRCDRVQDRAMTRDGPVWVDRVG
jgi:hypothetical protein